MSSRVFSKSILLALLALACVTPAHAEATYNNARVNVTVPPWAASPTCFYFQLVGVTQADPVVPGANFAISQADPGYQETYALLAIAAANKLPVNVQTTGRVVCGMAQIAHAYVVWPQ